MKLASLKGGRDGRLVVVSDDLAWCADAAHIVPTLQGALDDWDRVVPLLEALATDLNHEVIPMRRFHERDAAAPLPRAFQWADGSAYVNHVALVRQARGAEMPETFWHDPLVYQGGSDGFLGPRDAIPLADESWGCDMEAEVVVVTGDVPQGAGREDALAAIRLVGLTNDVSLRNLIPGELAKGFGFFQSKPASAFSPVFVTPEALGNAWADGKLHGALKVDLNEFAKGQKLAGLGKLNLHNNTTDASWMNEPLSYALYRAAGVPAPRTSYARVRVNAPGSHDNTYLGLYSIVENPDNNWAEANFGSKKGAIFKPVTPTLFRYLGDDWKAYNQIYDPKTELTDKQKRRVQDFAKLLTEANDADFARRLPEFLDVDEFSRFMAVTVWLSTLDSILTLGQNYVVYLHPKTDKVQFVPWDLDTRSATLACRVRRKNASN